MKPPSRNLRDEEFSGLRGLGVNFGLRIFQVFEDFMSLGFSAQAFGSFFCFAAAIFCGVQGANFAFWLLAVGFVSVWI